MRRVASKRLASPAALLVSTAILIALSVASVWSAPAWSAAPQERPMLVRVYRHLRGMVDHPQVGFQPALASLGEYVDPVNGRPAWWLVSGQTEAQPDFRGDPVFTERDARVFEHRACLGIWFESVRVDAWRVVVFDRSTGGVAIGVVDEPALASALRAAPPQELPRPSRGLSAWIVLDLLGVASAGVFCLSIVCTVRRAVRRPGLPGACASCGYDLTGLPATTCPECGASTTPSP